MDEPPDTGNATPPLATQLVQAEQKQCLTGLRLHIDSSCNSIHSFSMLMLPPPYTTNTNSLSPPAVSIPEPEPSREFDPSEEEEEEVVGVGVDEEEEEEEEEEVEKEEEEVVGMGVGELEEEEEEEEEEEVGEGEGEGEGVKTPLCPELASLCKAMDNGGLKNYMVKHFSDKKRLREQVPKALKPSENPAMLVSKCLDKFYLQGSRAYVQGSHMILQREASVLALECLLLTMVEGERVVEIAEGVKKDAKQAALEWKERLNSEGGIRKASDMDARAKKRYLFDLKSVYGCLKRHRIDPSKLVPGWQFNVEIMSLEQEIAELNELVCQEELAELVKKIRDKKMAQKRERLMRLSHLDVSATKK
ncbi:hypothetical protein RDI58_016514 [Solanum bulbocastanum]|uniref:FRIGIDA-like protein n=1 Tax=Solanum bulbocastanum TaxID=147425 RepID=A0AAN8YCJ2_SOLBU